MFPLSKPQRHVLFLDTDNAGRSILAEALLEHWGAGRFKSFSAGSAPAARPDPICLSLLRQLGVATAHLRSKSWSAFDQPDAPVMDFVFILCEELATEMSRPWPGNPIVADWSLPDPQAAERGEAERMAAYRQVFGMIERRVQILASLPLDGHARPGLQDLVTTIDRAEAARRDRAAA